MGFAGSERLEAEVDVFGKPLLRLTSMHQEGTKTWVGSIVGITNGHSYAMVAGTQILTTSPHVINLEIFFMTEKLRNSCEFNLSTSHTYTNLAMHFAFIKLHKLVCVNPSVSQRGSFLASWHCWTHRQFGLFISNLR